MDVMLVVLLYIAVTAPLLPLLLIVHGLKSDYTRLFQAALILQLVPIGLVFLPLGFVGVALLGYSLWLNLRRNRQFRAAGFDNPEVNRRWTREYLANLVAFGLAIEQKGVAFLFMEVAAHRGLAWLWAGLLPGSVILWGALAWPIGRERWALAPFRPDPVDRAPDC